MIDFDAIAKIATAAADANDLCSREEEIFSEALDPHTVLQWVRYTRRMEFALRHLSANGDTLTPQELVNVCADALLVDRHEYTDTRNANKSIIELGQRVVDLEKALRSGSHVNQAGGGDYYAIPGEVVRAALDEEGN
jgi:hypothetical protein